MVKTKRRLSSRTSSPVRFDVIVVGAGPAGSVVAWGLARQGAKVLILDRANFPRDKVCGDYVEPRGLRILQHMGVLADLEKSQPLPITHSATYIRSICRYRGPIPFYGECSNLPTHGYIIPRSFLDNLILQCAIAAGSTLVEGAAVVDLLTSANGVQAMVEQGGGRKLTYKAALLVGADGTNSVVARRTGLTVNDGRHIAVAQRGYAEGLPRQTKDPEEAAFYFDDHLFPGYGWLFPMKDGRANVGVGILAETQSRYGINVSGLFKRFFESLKKSNPRYRALKLCGPPTGGIVRTYGGAQTNYFAGGLLVGDAGSFVDPMTGEGITPSLESSLLATPILLQALEKGRFDAAFLSAYQTSFREYFDPSMLFSEFCACLLRNRSLRRSWLNAAVLGCQEAQQDHQFARTAGACFGGIQLQPMAVLLRVSSFALSHFLQMWPRAFTRASGSQNAVQLGVADILGWQADLFASFLAHPVWHGQWMLDVQSAWLRAAAVFGRQNLRYTVCGLDPP